MKNVITNLDRAKLQALTSLVNDRSQPNLNALGNITRNVNLLSLNIKALGYDLARQLAEALPIPQDTVAQPVGLRSKPSTQADIQSEWVAHWCEELKVPITFHRKIWELTFVLQAIFEAGHLRAGAKGLGFGCGTEPLPSYMASQGISTTVTDQLTATAVKQGWADTNQHTDSLQHVFHSHLVDKEEFDQHVSLRFVDMNAIPDDLTGYDFCWSICALEHLGSISKGLAFIENSLATVRPGGLAIHTTEYNINPEGETIDNWPTVLFQQKHLQALADGLTSQGHRVAPLDFYLGDGQLDRFVDLPPFSHDLPREINDWLGQPNHIKVGVDGFVSTCFGIIIEKAS